MTGAYVMSNKERLSLLLLLALFFASGLFDHGLWGPNDTREGAMIWDMYQSGTWVTPLLNGEPYLEKPPLLHWTGLLFCRLFGTVNEGLVRLPAALYGFGAVLLVWLLGRALGRERAGFAGAFLCATNFMFMEYSKIVLTDAALAFMVMLSFYVFWRAYSAPGRRVVWFAGFLAVSAASFYAKGLLGPGFGWVTVVVFLLYRREWKLGFVLVACFVPLFILALAPWVWSLWKAGGADFLRSAFWDNQFGRFLTFHNANLPMDPYFVHKEPFYYYLKEMPGALMPWLLLAIPAMIYWFRRGRELGSPLCVLLRTALVCMLLILHASSAKVACYLMPVFPVLFLMTGVWMEEAAESWDSRLARWMTGLTAALLAVLFLVGPVAYLALFVLPEGLRQKYLDGVDVVRDIGPGAAAMTAGLAIAAFALALLLVRRYRAAIRTEQRVTAVMAMPIVTAALLMLGLAVITPVYDSQRTFIPFASMVRREMDAGREMALGNNQKKFIGAYIFYLKSRLPQIVETGKDVTGYEIREFLFSSNRPAGVIVKIADLPAVEQALEGTDYRVMKAAYPGYMAAEFRLIVAGPTPACAGTPAGRRPRPP